MFPNKSGGVALYAHEAWRKYSTLDRPAGDVRLLDRLVGRAGRQRARRGHADPGRVVLRLARGPRAAPASTSRLPIVIGIGLIAARLAVQRLRRPAGGLVRLRDRRADLHPGVRADVPAVRHRRVVELEHRLQHRRQRRARARARLALLHVLVVVRDRGGRDVRARVPRLPARHAHGAAHGGAVLRARLRAAAARRRRHARHRGDRGRRDADRLVHAGVRRDRRQLPRRRDDLLRRRGPRAVDEHGDDGRLESAVRDRQGRHDDPPVREAQPLPRAGARDDRRRDAQRRC